LADSSVRRLVLKRSTLVGDFSREKLLALGYTPLAGADGLASRPPTPSTAATSMKSTAAVRASTPSPPAAS
jgi:hypothetical protein